MARRNMSGVYEAFGSECALLLHMQPLTAVQLHVAVLENGWLVPSRGRSASPFSLSLSYKKMKC